LLNGDDLINQRTNADDEVNMLEISKRESLLVEVRSMVK
jgi:hypothetical protein